MSRSVLFLIALSLLGGGVASARPCPNIMLVLDQSGSMNQDPNGVLQGEAGFIGSKYSILQDAVKQVVTTYGGHVPFGLELFSIEGNSRSDDACYSVTMVNIPISHNSSRAILDTGGATSALDGHATNTASAIKRAVSYAADKSTDPDVTDLHDTTPGKKNIILLVTDGDPDCGSDGKVQALNGGVIDIAYGNTTLNEEDDALRAMPSIKTYVVGFDGSGGVNPVNLENMGYYGGNKVMGCGSNGVHCYFQAGKKIEDFLAVLETIINQQCGGEFCDQCDDTCLGAGCPAGQVCTSTEVNPSPHCEQNACDGIACPSNSFCRAGVCITSCKDGCPSDQICSDGICVKNACAGVKCTGSQVCQPSNGMCIDFPCPDCPNKTVCDIDTGKCLADPCLSISCPKGLMCVAGGNCQAPPGGAGCSCSTVGKSPSGLDGAGEALAAAALLMSLAMLLRRRARSV